MTTAVPLPWQTMMPSSPPPILPPQPRPPHTGRFTLALAALGAVLGAAAFVMAINRPTAASAPLPVATPTYTADQIAAAKTKACTAAKLSSSGLAANTNRSNPITPDDALGWANFANGRTAYLLAALWLPQQADPATPQELKDAVSTFATTAGDSVALSISENKTKSNIERFDKNLDTLNVTRMEIERLCK